MLFSVMNMVSAHYFPTFVPHYETEDKMIFLQAAQPNPIMSFLPLIGIVVVFYFFFIRPQQKKAKQQTSFMEELAKGDEIATASGIIGKINKIDEKTITLQIDQKTFIRVLKATVSKEMTEALK